MADLRNPYPCRWPQGFRAPVAEKPIKASATWLNGALLKLTAGELEESGADPAAVVGIAIGAMTSPSSADPNAKLSSDKDSAEIYVADTQTVFNWPFTGGTPVPGTRYGVVKTSNVWYLDVAEVTAKVLVVVELDSLNPTTRVLAKFDDLTVVLQG